MFVIVQWCRYEDASVVRTEEGGPVLFMFRREAEHYAKENLANHWEVIYLL